MASIAPHIGRCECGEREQPDYDGDAAKMFVWMPIEPGHRYARCYGCGTIRAVTRTYENHHAHVESEVSRSD